jgi:cytosine/adenosine deaminase-related metal-dependent hydrolase
VQFIKSDKIFDGKYFLPEESVLVLDDQNLLIEIVTAESVKRSRIEHFEGIITPGFVNAHCHLELSHMKGVIAERTGLPEFGKGIITQRNSLSPHEAGAAAIAADKEMWDNGIVAVGDISNTNLSFERKKPSPITYHTFVEVLALDPSKAVTAFTEGLELLIDLRNLGLRGSLAAHAPYSTSLDLIKLAAEYDHEYNLPFCIHNQETEEEGKFFNGEESGFDELYKFLGIDLDFFKAPMSSSLKYFFPHLPAVRTMLVHNTFATAEDIALAARKGLYWCFCPAANLYIEGHLPDYSLFKNLPENICFGTDSLASNHQLDLVAEANLVLKSKHPFTLEHILQALTNNGAAALNLEKDFGRLHFHKPVGLNLLRHNNDQLQFIQKIV